jgi:hypothetical protein
VRRTGASRRWFADRWLMLTVGTWSGARLSVQALSDLEVSTESLANQMIRNSDCVGDNGE